MDVIRALAPWVCVLPVAAAVVVLGATAEQRPLVFAILFWSCLAAVLFGDRRRRVTMRQDVALGAGSVGVGMAAVAVHLNASELLGYGAAFVPLVALSWASAITRVSQDREPKD